VSTVALTLDAVEPIVWAETDVAVVDIAIVPAKTAELSSAVCQTCLLIICFPHASEQNFNSIRWVAHPKCHCRQFDVADSITFG
jgi:hypothetical protein